MHLYIDLFPLFKQSKNNCVSVWTACVFHNHNSKTSLILNCRPPVLRSRAVSPSPESEQETTETTKSSEGVPEVKPRIHRFIPDIQEIRVRWAWKGWHLLEWWRKCFSRRVFFLSVFSVPSCQRRVTYISWSHKPTGGWSATSWCDGHTSTSTTQKETPWSEPFSICPPLRWSTVRTNRQCSRYVIKTCCLYRKASY